MTTGEIARQAKDPQGLGEIKDSYIKVNVWLIRGQEFSIWYQSGNTYNPFKSTGRYEVRGKTEEDVVEQLKTKTRTAAVRVEIPISKIEHKHSGSVIVHGTITGIHQGTGNVLVQWHYDHRSVKGQLDRWNYNRGIYRRLTEEEAQKLLQLEATVEKVHKKLNDFKDSIAIKPIEEAQKAIDELMAPPEPIEEEEDA